MILLSEIAERLRDEVQYWAVSGNKRLNVRIHRDLADVRVGSSSQISEILLVVVGLLIRPDAAMNLNMDGNEESVSLDFEPCNELPRGLQQKLSPWNARVEFIAEEARLSLTMNLPSAAGRPPADIHTMAAETGISLHDARNVLNTMLPGARENIRTLKEFHRFGDADRCFRAAHTLKGSAKTLRAPQLAAAARAAELEARIGTISECTISRLCESWKVLESWINTEVYTHAE